MKSEKKCVGQNCEFTIEFFENGNILEYCVNCQKKHWHFKENIQKIDATKTKK
jgi:hypothetical protein